MAHALEEAECFTSRSGITNVFSLLRETLVRTAFFRSDDISKIGRRLFLAELLEKFKETK